MLLLSRASLLTAAIFFLVSRAVPSEPLVPIEGVVLNKITGAPVKRAHVIYTRLATANASSVAPISEDTDSQGHFRLRLVPGSYRVWVERAGYARQNYGANDPLGEGSAFTVFAGQELRDVAFRITPLGAISGRIFDEEGDPVAGVGIQVLRLSYASGEKQLVPVAGATSNDRGEYRCYDLPAGRYFVMATPKPSPLSHALEEGALSPEVQDSYAAVYYPGVVDSDAAGSVPLPEGGDVADVNLTLRKVRALTVRGCLLAPVKGDQAQLQVVLAHNNHGFASFTNRLSGVIDPATGRFEFRGVAPGSYLIVGFETQGRQVFSARAPVEITAGVPPEDIKLSLLPATEIQGSLQMDDGSAPPPNINVRLVAKEGIIPVPAIVAKPAGDGSIRLPGVVPGQWQVSLDPVPEGVWITSISFGDVRLLGDEVSVPPAARGPLHIVFGKGEGQVFGAVSRDRQPRRATVVLVPSSQELQRFALAYHTATTSVDGVYQLKNVPPGQYRLFAFESIEPFAWMDPAVIASTESMSQPITLAAGDRKSVDLTAVPYEATLPAR